MFTISEPTTVRTGRVPVASRLATWFFPRINGKYLNRIQLMASIREVNNHLPPQQQEIFYQLLIAKEPGLIQKKYRQFKLERLYDFNLSKVVTLADVQWVADEFNKSAAPDVPRLAAVNGLFSIIPPEKPASQLHPVQPEALHQAITELFLTAEAPLSRADLRTHLEARRFNKAQRTRILGLELGKLIGLGLVQETLDEKYFLVSRAAAFITSGLLIELFATSLTPVYVSRAGLKELLEKGRLLSVITPSAAQPRYYQIESIAAMLQEGVLRLVVNKSGTPAYCLAADLNQLLASGQVILGLDADQNELVIDAQSERAFQSEVFEYYLNSLRSSLKLASTEQAFLEALRAAFKIGISYHQGGRVIDFCYQAIRVSRLTNHQGSLLAALLSDVPLVKLKDHLSTSPQLNRWAEEIYEGLESYHLVRQLPFSKPDKKTHHHQNFMDLLLYFSGAKSRGQNPIAFILNFAGKLKNARAAAAANYPGKIEELLLFAILAERCGQRELADDLRSQYFRLHEPATALAVRNQREQRLGVPFAQAQIELAAFGRELKSELARVLPEAPVEVFSRIKSYYSIWQKVFRRHKCSIEELADLRGVRMVTDDLGHLYAIVGHLVNQHTAPGAMVKDYINKVKASGWRAINISCLDQFGREVEIQVMTREMLEEDRRGAAAHWIKRAIEETAEVFDQDPVDVVSSDLVETFRQLWQHVNAHIRLIYLGEDRSLKDFGAWLAGNLSGRLLRLLVGAIPADVAADRVVDKFSPAHYQGLVVYELRVNPKTNRLEIAASQAGGKVAEDAPLSCGCLASVKTASTSSAYLSADILWKIFRLSQNPRAKYLANLFYKSLDRGVLTKALDTGKDLIGPVGAGQLIALVRQSPFKNAEELFTAVGLGLYPLEKVKAGLDQLGIKLTAEPKQDGVTVTIRFTAPDRLGLLQALLQSASEAELISLHHQTLNLDNNTRVAEAVLTLRGKPKAPVPVSILTSVLEDHVKKIPPPTAGLSAALNYRVDVTSPNWQAVPTVLTNLFAIGINIFQSSLEDCAKQKIVTGTLYLEADPALSTDDILAVLAPLGKNLHLRELAL